MSLGGAFRFQTKSDNFEQFNWIAYYIRLSGKHEEKLILKVIKST